MIVYLAYATMAFGAVLTGIDVIAGLPTYWTLFEGPPTIIIGAAILMLVRRMSQVSGVVSQPPAAAV